MWPSDPNIEATTGTAKALAETKTDAETPWASMLFNGLREVHEATQKRPSYLNTTLTKNLRGNKFNPLCSQIFFWECILF